MSTWNWKPAKMRTVWDYGLPGLRSLSIFAPWIAVGVLVLMFHLIGGKMTAAPGVLFDLQTSKLADGEVTGPVALVMPMGHDTLLFFDDSRYVLGDAASMSSLAGHFSDRLARSEVKTLLVLADRRVSGGDLMKISELARRGGAAKILFAEKKGGASD